MKALLVASGLMLVSAVPAFAASMAQDTPVTMDGGLEAVCTGVGSGKNDPRWAAYPVRLEFSNAGAQFVAGVHLVLRRSGAPIGAVDCDAPWVLLKLPKGHYTAVATLSGEAAAKPRSVSFSIGGGGAQQRLEVQFARLAPNQ